MTTEAGKRSNKADKKVGCGDTANHAANVVKNHYQAVLIAPARSPLRYFCHIVSYNVSRWRV